MERTLVWIALFPLVGAVLNLLAGRAAMRVLGPRLGRELIHLVAVAAAAFACFLSFSLLLPAGRGLGFWQLVAQGSLAEVFSGPGRSGHRVVEPVSAWLSCGETVISAELLFDNLSGLMCAAASFVAVAAHVAAVGRAPEGEHYATAFARMGIVTASVLLLLLGKSLVLMFVGWQVLAMCGTSVHATLEPSRWMSRVGSLGWLVALVATYAAVGSLDVDAVLAASANGPTSKLVSVHVLGLSAATVVTLGISWALAWAVARGVSSHVCGRDLEVRALVLLGSAYICVRLFSVFALTPGTLMLLALLGCVCACAAALAASVQHTFARTLAYATVSHAGLVWLAVGMGAWSAAVATAVVGVCVQAGLALVCASVDRICPTGSDVFARGGLRRAAPWTRVGALLGVAVLAGVPSWGVYVGVQAYAYVHASAGAPGINYAGYVSAWLTTLLGGLYSARVYYLTFAGRWRGRAHPSLSPELPNLTLPIFALGLLALAVCVVSAPPILGDVGSWNGGGTRLQQWLDPVTTLSPAFVDDYAIGIRTRIDGGSLAFVDAASAQLDAASARIFVVLHFVAAGSGVALATALYRNGPSSAASRVRAAVGPLYPLTQQLFGFGRLVHACASPLRALGWLVRAALDPWLLERLGVGLLGGSVRLGARAVRRGHNGGLRRGLAVAVLGTVTVLGLVYCNPTISRLGPGRLNRYDLGGLRPEPGGVSFPLDAVGLPGHRLTPTGVRRDERGRQ